MACRLATDTPVILQTYDAAHESVCIAVVRSRVCLRKLGRPPCEQEKEAMADARSAPAASGGAELPQPARGPVPREQPKAKAAQPTRRRRAERPPIDLDDSIKAAQTAAKQASKMLAKARAEARTERKRRARLVRKAGQLSPADLERIAVLKRTGWWDPASGDAAIVAPKASGSASSKGESPAASGASSSRDGAEPRADASAANNSRAPASDVEQDAVHRDHPADEGAALPEVRAPSETGDLAGDGAATPVNEEEEDMQAS